jgi:hypothetical protein
MPKTNYFKHSFDSRDYHKEIGVYCRFTNQSVIAEFNLKVEKWSELPRLTVIYFVQKFLLIQNENGNV